VRQNFQPNRWREQSKRPHLTQRPPLSGQKFLPHSSQRKVVIEEVASMGILQRAHSLFLIRGSILSVAVFIRNLNYFVNIRLDNLANAV